MNLPRLNTSYQPSSDDLLNFSPYASKVQNIIRGLSNTAESIVIGIDGEWGSGKSTFSNKIFKDLESFPKKDGDRRIIKMKYNPWLYSGSEEMLFDFLNQMKKSYYKPESQGKKIGEAILKYSKYLKSVRISGKLGLGDTASLGFSFEPEEILKKLGEDLVNDGDGLIELKEQVNNLILDSDLKLVVFIDDLDRLDKDELFTILKLVKLTASFKHVVYVLCLDFKMVATSINQRFGENRGDGAKYLEKIINIPISIPLIEDIDRKTFVTHLLNKAFDQYVYVDLAEKNKLVQSLHLSDFNNPREAIRVINSYTYSLFAIGNEVNAHDLFWIEYLKIKTPDLYNELKSYGSILNRNLFFENRVVLNSRDDINKKVDETTNRDRLMKEFAKNARILDMLFPTNYQGTTAYHSKAKQEPDSKINLEKRISHANHFEKYFSFHTIRKISFVRLKQLETAINTNNYQNAITLFDQFKVEAVDDIQILRLLIESMRNPIDTGKVPINLIKFLDEYHNDCELNGTENIGIYDVIPELVAGLNESDSNHFKAIHFLCRKSNLPTALAFATAIASNFSIETALPVMDTLKNRVIAFEDESYFEMLDTNPYYFHLYWVERNSEELETYILDRLTDSDKIGHFLKLFVNFWNGQIRGLIGEEAFKLISEIINPLKLAQKIRQLNSDIITPKDLNSFSDHSNNTVEQLSSQFLYWENLKGIDV